MGSNIFNLLGVLGLGALLAPDGISVAERVLQLDFPVMVFVALVTLPVFYIDNRVSRAEGSLLLVYYIFYVLYIVMRAANSSALPAITLFILFFIPITFIALVMTVVRSVRARRKI
jgi:cation:H+ antiporter